MALRRDDDRRGGGFQYKPPSADKMKQRAAYDGSRFDTIYKRDAGARFKPRVGDNTVRILPPTWENHEHFGYEIFVHSNIGPDRGQYLCLKKHKGKPCPCCEEAEVIKRAGGNKDEVRALNWQHRVSYWLLDRDGEAEQPLIYDVHILTDRDICALAVNKRTGRVDEIDNPDEGFDIWFKRTGTDKKTKYSAWQIDRETTPIHQSEKKQNAILDFVKDHPIPDMLNFYDYDHIADALYGVAESQDERVVDDDDAPPRRNARRSEPEEREDRPARRSSRDEPEDDKPARRGGREPEDDPPSRSSRDKPADDRPARRGRDEEREDDRPARRSTRNEPEDDDRPARRGARDGEDREEDRDPPRRRGTRDEPADEDLPKAMQGKGADDAPAPRKRLSEPAESDDRGDDRPARRGSRDEDADPPRSRSAGRGGRDEAAEDDRPARRSRDEEEEPPRSRPRSRPADPDDEGEERSNRRR